MTQEQYNEIMAYYQSKQLPKELKVSEGIIRNTKVYVDSHVLRMEGDNTLLQGVSYRALVALRKILETGM